MRVYTSNSDVNVRLRLEEDVENGGFVRLTSVTEATRPTSGRRSWDFSSVDHSPTYDKVSVYFESPNPSVQENYLFDDVQFYGAYGAGSG